MTELFSPLHQLEALLFASDEPLSEKELKAYCGNHVDIHKLLRDLKNHYKNRGIQLECYEGNKWALRTHPALAQQLVVFRKKKPKLPRAALETLAICAYHQPVTRHDIEAIRGTRVTANTLDILLKLGWIKTKGRRKSPGRPLMFGITTAFLDHFGLESPEDLPGFDELTTLIATQHHQQETEDSLPFETTEKH